MYYFAEATEYKIVLHYCSGGQKRGKKIGFETTVSSILKPKLFVSPLPGSNQRPTDYKSLLLPFLFLLILI